MKVRSLSPATVIASIALFVSLSGSAMAGILITGANVKNGTLTGVDVKNESLGTVDVRNGSLLPIDFKPGKLPAGPQGPAGPAGPAGGQGPAGPAGPSGVSGYQVVSASRTVNGPFGAVSLTTTATCPQGKVVVGGAGFVQLYDNQGFVGLGDVTGLQVVAGDPTPRSWYVNVEKPAAAVTTAVVTARAFCMTVN
jgi:hypothetical protein